MQPQSYRNHTRFYPPHHFVFYPLLLLLLLACAYMSIHDPAQRVLWAGFAAILALLGWLSFMMRQHYALNNQNRIVRLEMRFRYFALTGQRLEQLEQRLSFARIAALRFAADEELPALTARALAEDLSPDEIKKAIRQWQPDHMRV